MTTRKSCAPGRRRIARVSHTLGDGGVKGRAHLGAVQVVAGHALGGQGGVDVGLGLPGHGHGFIEVGC